MIRRGAAARPRWLKWLEGAHMYVWGQGAAGVGGGIARGVSAERFETPLAGGDAASMRAGRFCWRAACQRRGGNRPRPGLPPEGETGKGEIKLLSPPGYFSCSPLVPTPPPPT